MDKIKYNIYLWKLNPFQTNLINYNNNEVLIQFIKIKLIAICRNNKYDGKTYYKVQPKQSKIVFKINFCKEYLKFKIKMSNPLRHVSQILSLESHVTRMNQIINTNI